MNLLANGSFDRVEGGQSFMVASCNLRERFTDLFRKGRKIGRGPFGVTLGNSPAQVADMVKHLPGVHFHDVLLERQNKRFGQFGHEKNIAKMWTSGNSFQFEAGRGHAEFASRPLLPLLCKGDMSIRTLLFTDFTPELYLLVQEITRKYGLNE